MPRVVIVGGGITGLSAAFELEQSSDCEILLLEAEADVGGKIQTARIGEFLVELGPDSIFCRKPWALDLIREIDAEHEVTGPKESEFSMLVGGALHRVPHGLVSLTTAKLEAVDAATFLSDDAKAAVRRERDVPAGTGEEESIAGFFRRRFGREFAQLVAEPLLAGTHGGAAEKLSMNAYYPALVAAEKKYGSLSAVPKPKSPVETPTFVTLRSGMNQLVTEILYHLVRTEIRTKCPVSHVRPGEVVTESGESIMTDQVIVATPSFAAARMLGLESLNTIRHGSSAILTLAYPRDAMPALAGTGFLVPQTEPCEISGCTWSSNKWNGRAPDDQILMRVFMGRDGALDVTSCSDGDLTEIGRTAIERILAIRGGPILSKLQRWHNGLPQYEVGHFKRLAQIDEDLKQFPGILLAGTSYRGVGIPDCIRQGREAANAIYQRPL